MKNAAAASLETVLPKSKEEQAAIGEVINEDTIKNRKKDGSVKVEGKEKEPEVKEVIPKAPKKKE